MCTILNSSYLVLTAPSTGGPVSTIKSNTLQQQPYSQYLKNRFELHNYSFPNWHLHLMKVKHFLSCRCNSLLPDVNILLWTKVPNDAKCKWDVSLTAVLSCSGLAAVEMTSLTWV